nr:DNA (cytosine-5-)-methyltransferase [Thermoactinomyces daqus]
MFKYASLFSGIGGFETALNKLGGECVFASEIDQKTAKSFEIVHGIKPHGDITKIDATEIPNHDLLVGGFPCQAFSIAGKRKGFEDTRGTLFFEVARIAAEKKPKVLLLENVKGLVSHDKGRTLEVIIQTLSELGYAVDFEVLNSKYFGVPQNRERIFIIGILDGKTEPYKVVGNNSVAKAKKRLNKLGLKTFNFPFPSNNEVATKLIDVLEENVAEKYYIKEEKAKKLLEKLNEKYQAPANDLKMVGHLEMKGADCVKRVYDPTGICPTLTTMGGGHREKIIEPQQFSDGYGISYCVDASYGKGIGPGSIGKGRRTHVLEVRPVLTPDRLNKRQNGRRFKEDGEPAFTLTAIDRHGIAIGHFPIYRIRKLTPLECFRLQGFPDEFYHKLKGEGISDSQLYKMAGNAVTVNVIGELGKVIVNGYLK